MTVLASIPRAFQLAAEPIAAVVFWAPEITEELAAVGIGPIPGYFCGRAAPMGRPTPAAVTAAFFNWSPDVVSFGLDWTGVDEEALATARMRAVVRALRRLIEPVDPAVVTEANGLLREAVDATSGEGRILYASTRAQPWPDDDLGALWLGTTLFREYRGDGHIAVLVEHGISGPASLLLHAGYVEMPERARDFLLQSRGWSDDTYASAVADLVSRGFIEEGGALTSAGMKFREMLEMETDRVAAPIFDVLGADRAGRLVELLRPMANVIVERKGVPRVSARLTREPAVPTGEAVADLG